MFASSLRALPRCSVSAGAAAAAVAATFALIDASTGSQDEQKIASCKGSDKKVVIVGGGTAGIGVAAMLQNQGIRNVTVVEPSQTHYYQPLWTLVAGGIFPNAQSAKPTEAVVPRGTDWIPQAVATFAPDRNRVTLDNGRELEYDYLVVAAGLKSDFTAIPGMQHGLEVVGSGVLSVYDYSYSAKVWDEFNRLVRDRLNSGMKTELIFTMPTTTLKCAGAPQKIMWLLEDTLRSKGLRGLADIQFIVPGGAMFGVPYYAEKIEKIRQERGVTAKFKHELVALDVSNKVATFKDNSTNKHVKQPYDLIHVCPNMVPPDFLKKSPLSDAAGWVDVDKHTLQSNKYPNVFALGDCANTPNSKTAAAVTSQAPVVVHNLERHMNGQSLDGWYSGYASCPLIIGQKKIMLLEFGYGGKLMETFGRDTGRWPWKYVGTDGYFQYRFFYFLKEQLFPYVYWNLWTRGRWYGTNGPFKPDVRDPNKSPKAA